MNIDTRVNCQCVYRAIAEAVRCTPPRKRPSQLYENFTMLSGKWIITVGVHCNRDEVCIEFVTQEDVIEACKTRDGHCCRGLWKQLLIYSVSQKNPPLWFFWHFFRNDWEFLINFYSPIISSIGRNV